MPDPELLPPPPKKSLQDNGGNELLPPPPPKKKSLEGSQPSSDGSQTTTQSEPYKSPFPSPREFKQSLPSYAQGNQASSTSVKLNTKQSAEDFKDKSAEMEARNVEVKKQAKSITAERRLKAKKQKIDDAAIKNEEAEIDRDIESGKLVLSTDHHGNKIYARHPGIGESFIKGLVAVKREITDAAAITALKLTGTPEQLASYYEMISHRKKAESEKEFSLKDISTGLPIGTEISDSFAPIKDLPNAAPASTNLFGIEIPTGEFAEFAGHIAPDIALASTTGGMNLSGKMATIGTKMYTSSYGNKAYELYEIGKQEAMQSGMDEKEASLLAAQAATKNATVAAIPDAVMNTLFFSGKLHTPVANNCLNFRYRKFRRVQNRRLGR
jgi:hypothetical protein